MSQRIHGSVNIKAPPSATKIVGTLVQPSKISGEKQVARPKAKPATNIPPKDNENKDLIPKDPKTKDDKLNTAPAGDDKVLLTVSGVFPFQLFPDKVIIDKYKVTIVRGDPLFKRLFPITFEDIQTVRVNNGILFSALEFEVRGFDLNPQPVTHLRQSDAKKAAELILKIISIKRAGGKL